jgi:glycosyltransferase involved in cell wall biosynthesis
LQLPAVNNSNLEKALKIVRVIARLNVGGPAKHVVWLTRGLQSHECESLLVAGTVPPGEEDMGYFATQMGVTPTFIQEMSREISLRDAITVWKLYQYFRREQPDIIHTHTAKAGTVGRLAGFLYRWLTPGVLVGQPRRCRFVHTYHGHIFHSYYGPAKTKIFITIERLLARLVTDRIIAISEQQRREINQDFKVGRASQFAVVPLGLDLEEFADWANRGSSFRRELGAGDSDVLIGIVGRLTEIKNHHLFLQAAAEFKMCSSPSDVRTRFIVIGDGALRTEIEQAAEALGLQQDVVFVGSRRDLEDIYPALDIVALTSRNEGTPLTLIEAMANARAVISTGVGGVVDLLGEVVWSSPDGLFSVCERVVWVNDHDPRSFAAGLAHLVANPSLRREIGQRGLQFVESRYSKDRLLEDIKGLYASLMDRNRSLARASATETAVKSRV